MRSRDNFKKKTNTVKLLGYSAAALSVVSFMTTLQGIVGVVTDSLFLASLISFGIQAIILVMGLWFIQAIKSINNRSIARVFKCFIIVLMILLYLCSIAFSTFYSYVYLSNVAYNDVKTIDYNMELELFLVENTKELKNINNVISEVLLKELRETAPRFKAIMDEYRDTANDTIQDIIGSIKKYSYSEIPEEARFSAQGAIDAYEAANRRSARDQIIADCRRLEDGINAYIDHYNERFYPMYIEYYNLLMDEIDVALIETRKTDIESTIKSMNLQIEQLKEFESTYQSINNYINSQCNGIISWYDFLIEELEKIKNVYDEILAHPDVMQGEELSLIDFYETIYSSDILDQSELEVAESELQLIISTYISNSEIIDEDRVESLVMSIEYLEDLIQCIELDGRIAQFEKERLAIAYIISIERDALKDNQINQEKKDLTGMIPSYESTLTHINRIQESEWIDVRHEDYAIYISLVKSLPDLDIILLRSGEREDANIQYLRAKSDENYVTTNLKKAYDNSRAMLEKISDMERARNYLYSDNSFLARLCLLIASFLDLASFLIGLFMYAHGKTNKCDETMDQDEMIPNM